MVQCHLCEKQIVNFDPKFHEFTVSEKKSVAICAVCAEKLVRWQHSTYAALFPTKSMKRMYGGVQEQEEGKRRYSSRV